MLPTDRESDPARAGFSGKAREIGGSSPALACLLLLAAVSPGQGEPGDAVVRLRVRNSWPSARLQCIRVSVPFPRGSCPKLGDFSVRGIPTAWLPLTRWPDGSIQWAQAQFVQHLGGSKGRTFEVVKESRPASFPGGFRIGARLQHLLSRGILQTEVEDPFGVLYRARLVPDPRAGKEGLLQATPLVRVHRFRDYHRPADPEKPGMGRDFLSLTAYLTLFHGFEHAELLLVLGNDYLGADDPKGSKDPNLHPLGTVRFRRFSLLVEDPRLAFVPRFIRENAIPPPVPTRDGKGGVRGFRQDLLPDGDGWYLADGSTKAFPLVLFAPEGHGREASRDEDETLRRQTATAMALAPLYGLPAVEDVQRSRALNAHGGPARATPDVMFRARKKFLSWKDGNHFGPFGAWGDIGQTTTTGTPRNTTIGLHLAVRAGSGELMIRAEGICLQQALRPYHLWGFEASDYPDIYVEGLPKWNSGWVSSETLGRKGLPGFTNRYRENLAFPSAGPYGMNGFDYGHFTVDLLYDFYCLTGSPFAREELRILGQQLITVLAKKKYFFSRPWSSRGEGWCMKGLVLCFQATGDPSLEEHAVWRLLNLLDRDRGKPPLTWAVKQSPHPNAFGEGVTWDAPWQQAAYVMGMEAGFRYFGHPLFRTLALDVADFMAGPGWVEGVGPKYFVATSDPDRYTLPRGYGPMGGTAEFEVTAFVLAADLAEEAGRKEKARLFRDRASRILGAHSGRAIGDLADNKWFQIYLDPTRGAEAQAGRSPGK